MLKQNCSSLLACVYSPRRLKSNPVRLTPPSHPTHTHSGSHAYFDSPVLWQYSICLWDFFVGAIMLATLTDIELGFWKKTHGFHKLINLKRSNCQKTYSTPIPDIKKGPPRPWFLVWQKTISHCLQWKALNVPFASFSITDLAFLSWGAENYTNPAIHDTHVTHTAPRGLFEEPLLVVIGLFLCSWFYANKSEIY